jgi:plasmid stability protein
LEIQTIREYREQGKAEYNIADGGNGGNLGPEVNKRISEVLQYSEKFKKAIDTKIRGRTVSAETRRKISDAKKGKQGHKWTEEQRQKFHDAMSGEKNPMFGKYASDATKAKISASVKASMTEEVREKIRKALKGRPIPEERKKRIGDAQRGEENHMFGKHPSEETR